MLSRFMAVSALSIVAIAGARYYHAASAPPERPQTALPEDQPAPMEGTERERHEQLSDLALRRGAYARLADQLGHELEGGTMALGDATERLFYFCLQNYPEHLQFVACIEPGEHIKTKLARNLTRPFSMPRAEGDAGSPTTEIAARLDRELRALPYEAESSGGLERH